MDFPKAINGETGELVSNFLPAYNLPSLNRQVVLTRRPDGIPAAGDFTIIAAELPSPGREQLLVRNLYLSSDPVQRGWGANPTLTPVGAPMRALAVGVVVESRLILFAEGAIVYGFFGWQDYAVVGVADLLSHLAVPRVPISAYAGVLGIPGVTAWLALLGLAPPNEGDTILVSTAAGAVGSAVAQIARQHGATVVGLTGSDEKVALCTSRYGYHRALNYKNTDLVAALREIQPAGFNTYFDNTGGQILDISIRAMAKHGRIIQCGTAATSSWTPAPTGLRHEREIMIRVLTWSGFFIFDHVARFGEAIDALTDMIVAGTLKHDEDIDEGMTNVTSSLEKIFEGINVGKKLTFIGAD